MLQLLITELSQLHSESKHLTCNQVFILHILNVSTGTFIFYLNFYKFVKYKSTASLLLSGLLLNPEDGGNTFLQNVSNFH
jgi:hypothetical protein